MSYRFIEEFRDKYRRSPYSQKGEEIWIIGPAPSLDDYPKDFFDDKISIAVNYAYLAFPRATFFFTNHKKAVDYVEKNMAQCLNKYICCYIQEEFEPYKGFIHLGDCGKKVIYFSWKRSPFPRAKENYLQMAKNLLETKKSPYAISRSALAQGAVEAAAFMGAKKITMTGCDEKMGKDSCEAKRNNIAKISGIPIRYKTFEVYMDKSQETFEEMRSGTRWLTETLREYGIEVQKYFYNEGYRRIM